MESEIKLKTEMSTSAMAWLNPRHCLVLGALLTSLAVEIIDSGSAGPPARGMPLAITFSLIDKKPTSGQLLIGRQGGLVPYGD